MNCVKANCRGFQASTAKVQICMPPAGGALNPNGGNAEALAHKMLTTTASGSTGVLDPRCLSGQDSCTGPVPAPGAILHMQRSILMYACVYSPFDCKFSPTTDLQSPALQCEGPATPGHSHMGSWQPGSHCHGITIDSQNLH